MSGIHIGKKIREVLDQSPFTVVAFAKRINLCRDGVYRIFARETIDTGMLKQVSKVLNHNFFWHYCAELPGISPSSAVDPALAGEEEGLRKRIENIEEKLDQIYKGKKRLS